jgi:hypothetical protein
MGIDLNLLDRRFKVFETRNTGAAILQAFEDSFARYCVIGDRWAPGEHVLLLSRTRFVGDLVDIGGKQSTLSRTLGTAAGEHTGAPEHLHCWSCLELPSIVPVGLAHACGSQSGGRDSHQPVSEELSPDVAPIERTSCGSG